MESPRPTSRTAIVYQITSPSGKRYIGVTVQGLVTRWADHRLRAKKGATTPLHAAIRKYGAELFDVKTLVMADWNYANELEATLIAEMGTQVPNGYNLASGGGQALHHEETKRKISEGSRQACAAPTTRRRRSEAKKAMWRDPAFRKKMSEERSLRAKAMWADPTYRARQAESQKQSWKRRHGKTS